MNTDLPAKMDRPTLLFVYNADSGLLNKLKDAVHKTFSPATYPCSLCDITYSPVHMRSLWKNFIRQLPFDVEFSYKDILRDQYHIQDATNPSAWLKRGDQLEPWLDAEQLDECSTLPQLMDLVTRNLPQIKPSATT